MADAELRQQRLQILMERRKARTNTANKKQELEDEKLKLHQLKTKSMREQWLLGGSLKRTPSESQLAEKRTKEDETLAQQLCENVRRLEDEVDCLERAEHDLLLQEKAMLHQLQPDEASAGDTQQEIPNTLPDDGEVQYIITEIPDLPPGFTLHGASRDGPNGHGERTAVYAMAISVEKDAKTGATRVVSSTPMSPADAQSRGIKVYDDGSKVVYAIGPDGQPLTNGVEPMSSEEVDALVSRASPLDDLTGSGSVDAPATEIGLSAPPSPEPKAAVTNASDGASVLESPVLPAGSVSPQAKSSPLTMEAVMGIETKDGLSRVYLQPNATHGTDGQTPWAAGATDSTGGTSISDGDINPERPVTMVFMGYEQVEDDEDTGKALMGPEGAGTAELVVIGDDNDVNAATPLTADPTAGSVASAAKTPKKSCACKCCIVM